MTVPALAHAAPPTDAADAEEGFIEYRTREGDTCKSIASRFFGDSRRFDVLHRHNPSLVDRPLPHSFAEGEILRIPSSDPTLGPDAQVTVAREEVRARPAADEQWNLAQVGLNLYRGWRVNTLDESYAEVTFRDSTLVELRQNTLVIIYGGTRTQTRRTKSEAVLERGTLRARLGELSGELSVDTPSSATALGEGQALVSVDAEDTTRVANHGGEKAKVQGKRNGKPAGPTVDVRPGFGSRVDEGEAPTPPRPLPLAPAWAASASTTFISLPTRPATAAGAWAPVEGAVAYRVELARNEDGRDVVASVRVPASVDRYEVRALMPGDYYARLATIDDDEFEGIAGAPVSIRVRAARLEIPAGVSPGGAPDGPVIVLPGTRLVLPPGAQCQAGSGSEAGIITYPIPIDERVQCSDEQGAPIVLPPIEAPPLSATMAGAAAEGQRLRAGETSTLSVSITSALELPSPLTVEAPVGWTVGPLERAADGTWSASVEVPASAEGEVTLLVQVGSSGRLSTLTEIPVAVEAAPIAVPPPRGPELHIGEIGLYGGLAFPSPRHELFEFGVAEYQQFARSAPAFGLRAAYHPIRWVGAELDTNLTPTLTQSGNGAVLYGLRAGVVGQLPYRVTPFVTFGGGGVGVTSGRAAVGRDLDGGFYFGGGLKFYALRRFMLRLDLRDTVLAGRGSGPDAHHLEFLFGAGLVLGRRTVDASGASPLRRRATTPEGPR